SSLICAPITDSSADAFLAAIHNAEQNADAVEMRFDYLPVETLQRALTELCSRIGHIGKPLILTFRPREQGGQRDLTLQDRRDFGRGLAPEIINAITFADFELDLVESFAGERPPVPWNKVICSWHDFTETPYDLIARFERMADPPAAIVKIATQANR